MGTVVITRQRKQGPTGKGRMILLALLVLALLFGAGVFLLSRGWSHFAEKAYPLEYGDLVEKYCEQYELPQSLVFAVIKNESGFHPDVDSEIGARGLMQITEETMDWIQYRNGEDWSENFEDLYDPETNVRYGTYLLSMLLAEFEVPQTALCAYHAGWGNVKRWLKDPDYSTDGVNIHTIPFKDTNWYVAQVLETQEQYKEMYKIE